jgi:hypothetical protein
VRPPAKVICPHRPVITTTTTVTTTTTTTSTTVTATNCNAAAAAAAVTFGTKPSPIARPTRADATGPDAEAKPPGFGAVAAATNCNSAAAAAAATAAVSDGAKSTSGQSPIADPTRADAGGRYLEAKSPGSGADGLPAGEFAPRADNGVSSASAAAAAATSAMAASLDPVAVASGGPPFGAEASAALRSLCDARISDLAVVCLAIVVKAEQRGLDDGDRQLFPRLLAAYGKVSSGVSLLMPLARQPTVVATDDAAAGRRSLLDQSVISACEYAKELESLVLHALDWHLSRSRATAHLCVGAFMKRLFVLVHDRTRRTVIANVDELSGWMELSRRLLMPNLYVAVMDTIDVVVCDPRSLQCRPSALAAAVVLDVFGYEMLADVLQDVTGYSPAALKPISTNVVAPIRTQLRLLNRNSTTQNAPTTNPARFVSTANTASTASTDSTDLIDFKSSNIVADAPPQTLIEVADSVVLSLVEGCTQPFDPLSHFALTAAAITALC